jgi:hypothetical protein
MLHRIIACSQMAIITCHQGIFQMKLTYPARGYSKVDVWIFTILDKVEELQPSRLTATSDVS